MDRQGRAEGAVEESEGAMITIYNFPRGARGVRVGWVCEEMGVPYQSEKITFPPSEAYLKLNPIGTVPFLTDEGGVAINESVAMALYVAERYGPSPLLPEKTDPAFARVIQTVVFSEASLGAGMNTLMAAKFAAPEADKQNWSVRSQEGRCDQFMSFAADLLGTKPYFAGETFTLADICMASAFAMWRGALNKALPATLDAFQERATARPAYQRAREKLS
jgi:glutathione S-transferase